MYVINDEKTSFEVKRGDSEYSIPSLIDLPYEKLQEFRTLQQTDSTDIIAWLADNVFGEYAPGMLDGLSYKQAAELCTAYLNQTDEEELGES